jgi:hypothetical protein
MAVLAANLGPGGGAAAGVLQPRSVSSGSQVLIAPMHQPDQRGKEGAALVSEPVLVASPLSLVLVGDLGQESVGDEGSKSGGEAADAEPESSLEVMESPFPLVHLAHDQEGPIARYADREV